MSVANVHRLNGLGAAETPREVARKEIGRYEVDFASARRPRASWQALANMLGVNAQDLRRACEEVAVALPAKPDAPAPSWKAGRPVPVLAPGSKVAALLAAVAAGTRGTASLAADSGLSYGAVGTFLHRLRALDFVDREHRVTPAGRVELKALRGAGHAR